MSPKAVCQNPECKKEIIEGHWLNLVKRETDHVRASGSLGNHQCKEFNVFEEGQIGWRFCGYDIYSLGVIADYSVSVSRIFSNTGLLYVGVIDFANSRDNTR